MSDPRIAVIGGGSLSGKRIYPYLGAAGAQLVGACDLELSKAETLARRFGGRAYQDWTAMLAAEQPDGVIVCIGPAQHAELAPAILGLGYPVYTEKPPAVTAAAALAMARASAVAGRLCMTAFKKRYATCYDRARRWLDGLPAGALLTLSIDYHSGHFANTSPRSDFLLDFCVHIIDLACYLGGPVDEVFAYGQGPDAYAVSLRFADGAVGSLSLSDGRSFGVPTEEVELTARGGNSLSLHNSSSWRLTVDGQPSEWREPPTSTSAGDSGLDTGHLAELQAFVRHLREGTPVRSPIAEGYRSLVLYEGIRASADRGQPVRLQYEPV
ncbi:MAG: Gfo/Idh/MocA family oxidoreductase [Fimbriimonadaceae bacterium]|nr:Gfo/Idh/MocA family oxidoreductase [Fimbriimonadaceae bacterium]